MQKPSSTLTICCRNIYLTFKPNKKSLEIILLEHNRFDPPAFFAHQLLEPFEKFGADACGVIGEIDQVPVAVLKNLKAKLVTAVMRDQCAV